MNIGPSIGAEQSLLIMLIQILVVLVVGLALMMFDIVEPTNLVFLIIMIAMLFTTIALNSLA